jgi:hypothetical protein
MAPAGRSIVVGRSLDKRVYTRHPSQNFIGFMINN